MPGTKKEGDAIDIDDLLAEVETDKATMEYKSFDRGTLLKILVPAGSVVQLGQPVAIIGTPGEDVSALAGGNGGAAAAKPSAAEAQPRRARRAAGRRRRARDEPAARGARRGGLAAHAASRAAAVVERTREGVALRAEARPRARARPQQRRRQPGPRGRIVARDLEELKPAPAARAAKATAPGEAPLRRRCGRSA